MSGGGWDCRLIAGGRNHVIHLAPVRRRCAAPVRASSSFAVAGTVGRTAPLSHPAIPDDLDVGIVGETAHQQFEGGEVATPHDDEFGIAHRIRAS